MPAYLETIGWSDPQKPSLRRFYTTLGFELSDTIPMTDEWQVLTMTRPAASLHRAGTTTPPQTRRRQGRRGAFLWSRSARGRSSQAPDSNELATGGASAVASEAVNPRDTYPLGEGRLTYRGVLRQAWGMFRRHYYRVALVALILFVHLRSWLRHSRASAIRLAGGSRLARGLGYVIGLLMVTMINLFGPVVYAGYLDEAVGHEYYHWNASCPSVR